MKKLLTILLLFASLQSIASVDGWASMNGGTTGGCGGEVVVVTNDAEFTAAVGDENDTTHRIVIVSGNFTVGYTRVGSNKTITGESIFSGISGTLRIEGVSNVIVQGLTIHAPIISGATQDAIAVAGGSTNFFIDHNIIYDWTDGAIDVTTGSNYGTISWNRFYQTAEYAHALANLNGANAATVSDAGKIKVTYHHNDWAGGITDRMPFVRYGQVHHYNNYLHADTAFLSGGISSYVTAATDADIRSENNWFENGEDPYIYKETGGKIYASGNHFEPAVTSVVEPTDAGVFTPPYSYTLQTPAEAKAAIIAGAGVQASYTSLCGGGGSPTPTEPTPRRVKGRKYKIVN